MARFQATGPGDEIEVLALALEASGPVRAVLNKQDVIVEGGTDAIQMMSGDPPHRTYYVRAETVTPDSAEYQWTKLADEQTQQVISKLTWVLRN
jgi:hypothetical protein